MHRCLKRVTKSPLAIRYMGLRMRPLTPALSPGERGELERFKFCVFPHGAHQFFVTRMPISFGSVRNTLVVRPLSSLFRKSPVIAVVLKTFLS